MEPYDSDMTYNSPVGRVLTEEEKLRLAEYLLVYFVRGGMLYSVPNAINFRVTHPGDGNLLHEQAPFMPQHELSYARPVQAYVACEWPKLAEFIYKHIADKSRLLATAPQVLRLRSRRDITHALDQEECRELHKDAVNYQGHRLSGAVWSRRASSHLRSSWSTCK